MPIIHGKSLSATTGTENNQFWIRWQHSLKAPESHTFVLKYRVIGGVQVHGETAEVYWKAIFSDRQAPVKAGTVTVGVPQALAGKILTYAAYGILYSHRAIDNRTVEFVANQALSPGQELEVRVSFPNSVLNFSHPQWQRINLFRFLGQHLPILFGLGVGGDLTIENVLALAPILFGPVVGASILGSFLLSKRCPQCGKFTLERSSSTLEMPTWSSQGKQQVVEHCWSCSYRREFEQVLSYSSSSSDGGGGGGDGGGGGGG